MSLGDITDSINCHDVRNIDSKDQLTGIRDQTRDSTVQHVGITDQSSVMTI